MEDNKNVLEILIDYKDHETNEFRIEGFLPIHLIQNFLQFMIFDHESIHSDLS